MSSSDFWSRRKAAVQAEETEALHAQKDAELQHQEAKNAEKTDQELLDELGLPDPDGLGQGDDFTAFLKETVPERLRRRALRRLWASNPVLANVDGLVDYGEDFTDASCVIEGMQTAYQLGKGMTAHVQELQRQMDEKAGILPPQSPEPAPEEEPVQPTPAAVDTAAQSVETGPACDADVSAPFETSEEADFRPVARMRFVFDDDVSETEVPEAG